MAGRFFDRLTELSPPPPPLPLPLLHRLRFVSRVTRATVQLLSFNANLKRPADERKRKERDLAFWRETCLRTQRMLIG